MRTQARKLEHKQEKEKLSSQKALVCLHLSLCQLNPEKDASVRCKLLWEDVS